MKKALAIILSVTLLVCACSFAVNASESVGTSDPGCCGFFMDSLGWGEVYEYAWDSVGNGLLGEWPGTKLTDKYDTADGTTRFSLIYPEGLAGIVLSTKNADGSYTQTADLPDSECITYYLDGSKDGMDHYYVKPYDEQIPSAPVWEKFRFTVDKSLDWDIVYFYAWDDNGDRVVDILDAIMVQKAAAGIIEFEGLQITAADVNFDKKVDILDASEIQKYTVGKSDGFFPPKGYTNS